LADGRKVIVSYISDQLERVIRNEREPLKPCPFCGSNNVRVDTFQPYEAICWVECGRCGTSGSRAYTIDEAIKAWNRRTSTGGMTEFDYRELRDRFGKEVEFIVRDMVDGKEERWK
jgi:Lar family restriction alleviation protein